MTSTYEEMLTLLEDAKDSCFCWQSVRRSETLRNEAPTLKVVDPEARTVEL